MTKSKQELVDELSKGLYRLKLTSPIELYTTEELIAELKRRGLGVFNLSLPFIYKPKDESTN